MNRRTFTLSALLAPLGALWGKRESEPEMVLVESPQNVEWPTSADYRDDVLFLQVPTYFICENSRCAGGSFAAMEGTLVALTCGFCGGRLRWRSMQDLIEDYSSLEPPTTLVAYPRPGGRG